MTISEQLRRLYKEECGGDFDELASRFRAKMSVTTGTLRSWVERGFHVRAKSADEIADKLGYEWVLIPKGEAKE